MELSVDPTFQDVTWIVKDYLELGQERGSFLDSPEFLFSGNRYCLRIYPKGEGKDRKYTQIQVRRLRVSCPDIVSCEMYIRKIWPPDKAEFYRRFPSYLQLELNDVDELYSYWWLFLEKDRLCDGFDPLEQNEYYARTWIEKESPDMYGPDGSLTVMCRLWLRGESRAGSSNRGKEERGGFPGHCHPMEFSRWSSPEMELITEFPITQVSLIVPKVFELLEETSDSLTSPKFCFAGDTYCFRLEAKGDTADTHLELVRLTSTLTENTVFYSFGRYSWPTYPMKRLLVGCRGFCLSRSKLEEERDYYAPCGTLELVLFLHLGERRGFTDLDKLQSDLRQLLKKETESDARFVVRGKEFPVHRNVLRARSTVFEAMFGHDTPEKESGRVVDDDLDPDAFGDFLEYMYSGDVQAGLSDDNVFGLYVAADKYGVFTLKSKCADYMRRSLSVDSFCDAAAADKYDVSTLRSECMEHMRRTLSVDSFCDVVARALRHREEHLLQQATGFFKDNIQDIIITAKWQQFMCDNPTSANELLIKAIVPGKQ